ncbi:MAG: hypothetical protein ACJ74W_08235 [Pyrinomonadaceae bacterium]
MAEPTQQHPAVEAQAPQLTASSAQELGLWLLALRSFLNLRNHPLNEMERAELLNRDFKPETRIAQQTLRRCLRLALQTDESELDRAAQTAVLLEVLGDAHGLCEALLAAPQVSFHGWGSFGRLLARELDQSEAAHALMQSARAQTSLDQQPELFTLTERLTPDTLGADMQVIFARLSLLLDELRFVEQALRRDTPLKQNLPLFTLAHEEARTLIELIESRALNTEEFGAETHAILDGAGYAVSMELCKVFAHELVGLAGLRDPAKIYARVENAHGLLRDCFQQTVVGLAQAFDPTFDGTRLFQTFRTRHEQSLLLRNDLWTLLQVVRAVEREADQRPLAPLLARLSAFQAGNMSHLMFKDWEAFERFVQELKEASDPDQRRGTLHRFGTYLEALFTQINMRAALADHPFEYPAVSV